MFLINTSGPAGIGDWVLSRTHLLTGMSKVFVRNIAVLFETTLRKRLRHDRSRCAEVLKPQTRSFVYAFLETKPFKLPLFLKVLRLRPAEMPQHPCICLDMELHALSCNCKEDRKTSHIMHPLHAGLPVHMQ